jgi:hypothetical protein
VTDSAAVEYYLGNALWKKAAMPRLNESIASWSMSPPRLGTRSPWNSGAMGNLAVAIAGAGSLRGSRAAVSRSLATEQRVLGPEHPDTGLRYVRPCDLSLKEGRLPTAKNCFGRRWRFSCAPWAREPVHIGGPNRNLADALQGRPCPRSGKLQRETLERTFAPSARNTPSTLYVQSPILPKY